MTPYRWAITAFVTAVTLMALNLTPATDAPVGQAWATVDADALPQPSLHAEYVAPLLVLRGEVPSRAEHAAIVQRARALYGAQHVEDRLRVAPVVHPSWMSAAYLPDLRAARHARATLHDARLQIDGEAPSARARDALVAQVDDFRSQGLAVDTRIALSE